MKKTSIQDIAKELNLSRNTVAKALGAKGYIADDTRKKIIKKAREMGYTKLPEDAEAGDEAKTEIKTVLVLTRTDVSLFWSGIIMGINNELNTHGCNINIQFANEEAPQQFDYISAVTPSLVGILVLSVYSDKFLWPFLELDVPIVFLDTGITDVDRAFLRGDVVLNEGVYSVESLTRHLIAQGIKNIGFIGDITYCRSIRDRYDGFLLGLKSTDIEPDESIIAVKHMPERYYLRHEVEEALSCFKYIPEAIVCANDDIAMHVIGALRAREFRVPDDVAVTGYDDLESLIEHITPFISTVKIHHAELGKRLARQLMWRIENPDASKEITVIRGEVIIRGSSARQSKNKSKGE